MSKTKRIDSDVTARTKEHIDPKDATLPQSEDKVLQLLRILCDKYESDFPNLMRLGIEKEPNWRNRAQIITPAVTEACRIVQHTDKPLFRDDNRQILKNIITIIEVSPVDHILPVLQGFNSFINDTRDLNLSDKGWSALIESMARWSHFYIGQARLESDPKRIKLSTNPNTPSYPMQRVELMRNIATTLLDRFTLGPALCREFGNVPIADVCRGYLKSSEDLVPRPNRSAM